MRICEYNKCTGCGACANACPINCITMREDAYGEIHPNIDINCCINCGRCQRSCPNNNNIIFNHPLKCYAAYVTNYEQRKICASGGLGTAIAEYVLIKQNGVLFGTRYDKNMMPIVASTEDINDLGKYKGSKYVQSIIGLNTYKSVREYLAAGRQVVFIGTPCQIAGLICFLGKYYCNLLTVDLICHGVCPTRYLAEEIEHLKNKNKISHIDNIRFRGNDGNDYKFSMWNRDTRVYVSKFNYYLTGFLDGITLRENCYACNYARPERISDITIGDFIGLGKTIPYNDNPKNISSVFINSEKGYEFYQSLLRTNAEIRSTERPLEERLKYGPSLRFPFPRPDLNKRFRELYPNQGFIKASHIAMGSMMRKKKIRYIFAIPYKAARKVFWKIIN